MTSGLIASVGSYNSGTTTVLIVVVAVLLLMARRIRRRRHDGEYEGRKSNGLVSDLFFAFFTFGEVVSLVLAWLVITHASSLVVGVAFGVLLGAIIGDAAFSFFSKSDTRWLKSFWELLRDHPRNPSIAAGAGVVVSSILFGGSIGGDILLAGVAAGIAAGIMNRSVAKQKLSEKQNLADLVASALGISTLALDALSWHVEHDGAIVIKRPGAALLRADGLADRVATLLPDLEVTEVSTTQIVFSPLSDEVAMSRFHNQVSGGLVTGTTDDTISMLNVAPKTPDIGVREHVVNLEDLL